MRIEEERKGNFQKKRIIVEKSFRQIHISDKIFYHNMKTYKGSRKDTNLLNIKFKTIICRILEQISRTKQVTVDQFNAIQIYKQSPPSFQNLITLIYRNGFSLQNNNQINPNLFEKQNLCGSIGKNQQSKYGCEVKSPNILKTLKKLFESSEIIKKIYETEGKLVNKFLMLKYLQAIRYTIIGNGKIVKWKQLKSVTVLK